MRKVYLAAFCAAWPLMGAAGCASYQPAPFEAGRHDGAWDARAKEAGHALSLPGAVRLALRFNPQLRSARAEAGVRQAGAPLAGLPEDPSLNAGLGRQVSGGASPWLIEGGLAFTLPLSDRWQAQADHARRGLSAAQSQVVLGEAQVVRQVREAFARWQGATAREAAWAGQARRLDALQARLRALVTAGSVPAYEADAVDFARIQSGVNRLDAAAEAGAARLRILALCGLRPECPVVLQPADAPPAAGGAVEEAGHPARLAAQAAFDEAEGALRVEVARSRPELSLGPTGKRESGETTLGLGLGLSLPIWNRNQKAIAEAAAGREVARVALEKTIESLAHGAAEAAVKERAATQRLEALRRDMQPILERQTATIDRLVALGEFDPLRLMDLLDRRIQWELSLVAAGEDLAEARSAALYFSHPLPSFPKDPAQAEARP